MKTVPSTPVISLDGRMDEAASRFGAMSCAQALASAYGDLVGLDEDPAMNLTAGFGLGMGRKETCGAVTVMTMYVGLGGVGDQSLEMINIEREMGSTICQDFLDDYGNCTNCIRCAAGLLETHVFGEMSSKDGGNSIMKDGLTREN